MSKWEAMLEKKTIRKSILALRDALTGRERREKSLAVQRHLFGLPQWPPEGVALFFYTMRSEVITPPMIEASLAAGVEVALPRMAPGGGLHLQRVSDLGRDLAPNSLGIMEPLEVCPEVPPESIGIILVPGAAFDSKGTRVGYGGGYYDRLLALAPRAHRIALAFDLQRVPALPRSPHDIPVDVLVTESGPVKFRANDRRGE